MCRLGLLSCTNTFCRIRSLSNATFSFLITWRVSSSKFAAVYKMSWKSDDFCRAMLCNKRGLCRHAVSVCLCVRPSVTFVDHVKTNKHIFEIFSPSGSHAILVFPHQRGCRYSDEHLPNGGVECMWGISGNRDSGLIAGYRRLLDCEVPKTFTDDEAEYMTKSATHHWQSIDCWTC